jgi:hypothetical protein
MSPCLKRTFQPLRMLPTYQLPETVCRRLPMKIRGAAAARSELVLNP